MADIVASVLRSTGAGGSPGGTGADHGPRLVEPQQPPRSGHDCGACGGGRGGPNARAFALMANDPRVRKLLKQRGAPIPLEPRSSAPTTTRATTPSLTTTWTTSPPPIASVRAGDGRHRSRPAARRPRAVPSLRVGRPSRSHPRRRCGTSRTAPRTSRRCGPSTATPPTRSAWLADASGAAGCSWTAGRSSPPTIRPWTTTSGRCSPGCSARSSRSVRASTSSTTSRGSTTRATAAARSCRTTSRRSWA